MRPTFLLIVAIAVFGGCTRPDERTSRAEALESRAGVVDSAGIRIVANHSPVWVEGEGWSVSFEPLLTIGMLNGPAEYQLFDVVAARRQSDGDIALVDAGSREVRLYDRDGRFLRTLGGPGSGPGEFVDPAQLLLTTGDTIVVWDNANFQITRFEPDGDLVSVEAVDRGWIAKAVDPPLYPASGELLPNGQVLVRLIEKTGKLPPPGAVRAQSGALRVSPDQSIVDTLAFFNNVEQVKVEAPWGPARIAPPAARRTAIAIHPVDSEVCIGEQVAPEVTCFAPDGSRILVRWPAVPEPVTSQEVTAWRQAILDLYTVKMSEAVANQVLDLVPVPAERPPYSALALDRSGNLWVRVGPVPGSDGRDIRHLVFDRSGQLLGRVLLPPVDVLEIGEDYVLGVFRDELEIEYLQVHRLAK